MCNNNREKRGTELGKTCQLSWQIQGATAVFYLDLVRGNKKSIQIWITEFAQFSPKEKLALQQQCFPESQIHRGNTDIDQTWHVLGHISGNILIAGAKPHHATNAYWIKAFIWTKVFTSWNWSWSTSPLGNQQTRLRDFVSTAQFPCPHWNSGNGNLTCRTRVIQSQWSC